MIAPNPFSTCYTRPGAIPFRLDEISIGELAESLFCGRSVLQIVGQHGSGKTTLTIELGRFLQERQTSKTGSRIGETTARWITLRKANRVPFQPQETCAPNPFRWLQGTGIELRHEVYLPTAGITPGRAVWFIDGLESLNQLQRIALLRHLPGDRDQIVLTTHRRLLGIPVLYRTRTSGELFCEICRDLMGTQWSADWSKRCLLAFERTQGDIREALFQMYDEYQATIAVRQN